MITILFAAAMVQPLTIAVNSHVLGYRDKHGWHQVDKAFANTNRSITYTCLGLDKKVKSIGPTHLEGSDDEPPNGWFISAESARKYVSVSGFTPRFPRRPKLFKANAAYQKVVLKYLKTAGVKTTTARIVKSYIVDLDGDGTMEVILNARSRDNFTEAIATKPGDYSLLLLRSIKGGKVVETPLQFTYSGQYTPENAELNCIVDLDGDGRMEIVTSGTGYEWSTGRVWNYSKGVAEKMIEATEGV